MGTPDIKAFLANPATFLMPFGIGCIAVVWKFKMNASTSNLGTFLGAAALAASIPFLTGINSQPYFVRVLSGMTALGAFGLAAYYMLWIPKSPIELMAVRPLVDSKRFTLTDGKPWPTRSSEVHLFVFNRSGQDYENLDLKVGEGQGIAGFAKVEAPNDLSMWFHDVPKVEIAGMNSVSKNITAMPPLVIVASQQGIRIRCSSLPKKCNIELAFSFVTMSPQKSGGPIDQDYWVCTSLPNASGETNNVWFSFENHSENIFDQKPPEITHLKVEAHYQTTKRNNVLTKTIEVLNEQKAAQSGLEDILAKNPALANAVGASPSNTHMQVSSQWSNKPLESITGRKFVNERIDIDGKSFNKCEFENVTLFYKGVAGFQFIDVKLKKPIQVTTDNPAVIAYQNMYISLMHRPEFSTVEFKTIDPSGNQNIVYKTATESPEKKLDPALKAADTNL